MSFSTLPFLFYFLPAFLAVYYIVPARFRNAVLAPVSYTHLTLPTILRV